VLDFPHAAQACARGKRIMNRLRSFLWISLAVCSPSLALADGAGVKLCNQGAAEIHVAVASRIQNFLVGYRWETTGWYEVSSVEVTMDDFGVVIFSDVVKGSSTPERTESYGAVLASLDLFDVASGYDADDYGCMFVLLKCKYGLSCVRSYYAHYNSALVRIPFYVNSKMQLDKIEVALGILENFYPENLGEVQ
jgi:hypothetical protein